MRMTEEEFSRESRYQVLMHFIRKMLTDGLISEEEYCQINKKRKKNRGELPQYLVAGHHEPIIDRETFDFVQAEMARRKELGALANKSLNTTCFTGKLKCPHCGKSLIPASLRILPLKFPTVLKRCCP